jgi:uncharacterized alpha-E superfamily protein
VLLSRTADNLFWMSRYIERAESARLIQVARRMAMTAAIGLGIRNEWESVSHRRLLGGVLRTARDGEQGR